MTSLTSQFDLVLNAIVDNERRSARRIGKHVDRTKAALKELKEQPAPKALPAAADFKPLTDKDLRKLLTHYKVPGRGAKGLKRADRVALCIANGVPALTFDFLLDFYLQATT